MSERLVSVGLDVGTTTTQLIVSELWVENRASAFAVPELEIVNRNILYKSPVYETPLLGQQLVDGEKLRDIVEREYRAAGVTREQIQTGALIVTGETSRKENARTAAQALSDLAGEFVVTTAGPDLESVLAARGAGAAALSQETERPVIHLDIGGGTTNLALLRAGRILATGCMNVGGRLMKLNAAGEIQYVSPVLAGLTEVKVGDRPDLAELTRLTEKLTRALEMAVGLRERTALYRKLWTAECTGNWDDLPGEAVLSFSGGVAACMERDEEPLAFGDLGPLLAKSIENSRLCRGEYRLGRETIRATVIGAGCHSAQLSGSTVFHRNISFPVKNLPVVRLTEQEQSGTDPALIRRRMAVYEGRAVLALPGYSAPEYARIQALAGAVAAALPDGALVAVEQDMAKALGQSLALVLGVDKPCLCLDRVRLNEGDYLDVGAPVGPAIPVVVKTLIFGS